MSSLDSFFINAPIRSLCQPQNVDQNQDVVFKPEPDTPEEQQRHNKQLQKDQHQSQKKKRRDYDVQTSSKNVDIESIRNKKRIKKEALKSWKRFCKKNKRQIDTFSTAEGSFESILEYIQRVVIPFDIEFGARNHDGNIRIAGAERFLEPILQHLSEAQKMEGLPNNQATERDLTPATITLQTDTSDELKLRYISLVDKHKTATLRVERQQVRMSDFRDRIKELQDRVEELEDERHWLLQGSRNQQEKVSRMENRRLASPQEDKDDSLSEDIILDEGVAKLIGSVNLHSFDTINDIGSSEGNIISQETPMDISEPLGTSTDITKVSFFLKTTSSTIDILRLDTTMSSDNQTPLRLPQPSPKRDALPPQSLRFQDYCAEETSYSGSSALLHPIATFSSTNAFPTSLPVVKQADYSRYLSDFPSDSSMSPELPNSGTAKVTTIINASHTKTFLSRKHKSRQNILRRERQLALDAAKNVDARQEKRERALSPQFTGLLPQEENESPQETSVLAPILSDSISSSTQAIHVVANPPLPGVNDIMREVCLADNSISPVKTVYIGSLSHPVTRDPRLRHLQANNASKTEVSVNLPAPGRYRINPYQLPRELADSQPASFDVHLH
ncbi:hypothetical protein BGZ46_000303 [Entomortierella lignicola]|nr:hypothetical protein BGZ46_000303 [Entomortierella lignicola]